MKTILKMVLLFIFISFGNTTQAQTDSFKKNYFQLSPRIGYDFPTYNNNTPYIDYKGGLEAGISADYYWNWIGIGIDFDYIKNNPKSIYPTTNLYYFGNPITNFNLTEAGITRTFLGVGPNFQLRSKNGKLTTELNTRFGISSIKGGRTLLVDVGNGIPLNFHAGYNDKNVFSYKTQVRVNYFFNQARTFGAHLGVYYLRHFGVTELSESGLSALYQSVSENSGDNLITSNVPNIRQEPCDCDISSVGLFAGITFRLAKNKNVCTVCKEDHTPHCCTTCGCSVTITAKDKFTGETLPNTDVVLTDINGNIVESGTTNSYGVVVFKEVTEENYLIRGKLYNVTLEEGSITKTDFKGCEKNKAGIQKVIEYADENFILKGNVVECNTPNGIQGVDILLQNKLKAGQKNTLSDANGNFIFHLNQISTYELSGKKDGYYSNKVDVTTNSYNRKNTLFIEFEMCVDPCGKAIMLDNINFDLDKAEILPEAISDLQRVVKLMKGNPNIKVEMSSHTDSQGSDEYNRQLSQRRADATVNYIVNQGISRSRLIARGAGESELKNTKCANNVPCTDDEHRINRRTEFKVVCY